MHAQVPGQAYAPNGKENANYVHYGASRVPPNIIAGGAQCTVLWFSGWLNENLLAGRTCWGTWGKGKASVFLQEVTKNRKKPGTLKV